MPWRLTYLHFSFELVPFFFTVLLIIIFSLSLSLSFSCFFLAYFISLWLASSRRKLCDRDAPWKSRYILPRASLSINKSACRAVLCRLRWWPGIFSPSGLSAQSLAFWQPRIVIMIVIVVMIMIAALLTFGQGETEWNRVESLFRRR